MENNIVKTYLEPAHELCESNYAMLDSRNFRAELE